MEVGAESDGPLDDMGNRRRLRIEHSRHDSENCGRLRRRRRPVSISHRTRLWFPCSCQLSLRARFTTAPAPASGGQRAEGLELLAALLAVLGIDASLPIFRSGKNLAIAD